MAYATTGGSPTINVLFYTHVRGSPKNKVKTFTPVGRWIVKYLTKIDDKYASFLQKR